MVNGQQDNTVEYIFYIGWQVGRQQTQTDGEDRHTQHCQDADQDA